MQNQQQTDNQKNADHISTLRKLLDQIGSLNLANAESRSRLEAAVKFALEVIEKDDAATTQQPKTDGGIDLSESAEDTLLRVIEGRPSRTADKKRDAVMFLASLVNDEPQRKDETGAVGQLAGLIRRTEG